MTVGCAESNLIYEGVCVCVLVQYVQESGGLGEETVSRSGSERLVPARRQQIEACVWGVFHNAGGFVEVAGVMDICIALFIMQSSLNLC